MDKTTELTFHETTKLVIVGAGIAGLAAAFTLEKEQFKDYIILEAQNVVGGRIHSVHQKSDYLEYGAQFLHGDQSNLANYCFQKNLISARQSSEGEGLFLQDDGVEVELHLVMEVRELVENLLAECEAYATNNMISHTDIESNIGKLLRARFLKYIKMKNYDKKTQITLEDIFDWHVRFLKIDNACMELEDLSVKKWGNFEITGGSEYNIFKDGYSSLIQSLLRNINIENVKLNSAMQSISYDPTSCKCVTSLFNGTKICSDCVLVTCSLGYLKEHHKTIFRPPLPSKLIRTIENLGFGLINKIYLDFEVPWWEPSVKGFQLLWRSHASEVNLPDWTRDLSGFDVVAENKGMLLGWVAGKGAYLVEQIDEEQVAKDCHKLLQQFLKRNNIPEIKLCVRTKWYSNKFILGSYSHITINCDAANVVPEDLLEPVWSCPKVNKKLPLVMLAGEASSKHYYSTTHGAFDTGVQQAKVFLNHHNDTKDLY